MQSLHFERFKVLILQSAGQLLAFTIVHLSVSEFVGCPILGPDAIAENVENTRIILTADKIPDGFILISYFELNILLFIKL